MNPDEVYGLYGAVAGERGSINKDFVFHPYRAQISLRCAAGLGKPAHRVEPVAERIQATKNPPSH